MSRTKQISTTMGEHKPRRAHARLRVGIPAVFETLSGKHKVSLVDLSQGGAHLRLPGAGRFGDGVLSWMRFEVFAMPVWQRNDEFGVEFDRPLSYDDLLEIRSRAPTVVQEEAMSAALAARDFVAGITQIGVDR